MRAKLVYEDINILDNRLKFDYKSNNNIKLNLGKHNSSFKFDPYHSKSKDFLGYEVISAYSTSNIKKLDRREILTPVFKALKGQIDVDIEKDDLDLFLTRTALYLSRYIKQYNIDTVITVKSSSELNNLFAEKMINYLGNVKYLPDSIYKNDLSKLEIINNPPERIREQLIKKIEKIKKENKLSLGTIHSSLRKYIGGVFSISDIYNFVNNKNILIIDDILTTRTTMSSSISEINKFAPNNILGVTIFK